MQITKKLQTRLLLKRRQITKRKRCQIRKPRPVKKGDRSQSPHFHSSWFLSYNLTCSRIVSRFFTIGPSAIKRQASIHSLEIQVFCCESFKLNTVILGSFIRVSETACPIPWLMDFQFFVCNIVIFWIGWFYMIAAPVLAWCKKLPNLGVF